MAYRVIQQHSATSHPVALEGDPEDNIFLVRVGNNYRKIILALSRGKEEGDHLIFIGGDQAVSKQRVPRFPFFLDRLREMAYSSIRVQTISITLIP